MVVKVSHIFCVCFFFTELCNCAGYAQVPVSEEPMHHKVFQNDYIRILDVHVFPKDTTLFHKHELPSVFIVLSNVKTGSELLSEGATANAPVTYGNIWFDGFYGKPRIHRVWNSDTMEFHVMDIELLKRDYEESVSPLKEKSFNMLFDEKPATGYRAVLHTHSNINLKSSKQPVLVVCLSDSTNNVSINGKTFQQKGDFIFIPPGIQNAFINDGRVNAELAIFELK